MIILAIIGTIFCEIILIWLAVELADNDKGSKAAIAFFIGIAGIILLTAGVLLQGEKNAYKDSLEGNNPYKKEYIYKQVDSTYVIIDSVYVKK